MAPGPHRIGVRVWRRRRLNVNGNSDGRASHLEFIPLVFRTEIRGGCVYGNVLHFGVRLLGTHLVVVVAVVLVLMVTLQSRVENGILMRKTRRNEKRTRFQNHFPEGDRKIC